MTDTILPIAPQYTAFLDNLETSFASYSIPVGETGAPRDANNRAYEPPYIFVTLIPGGLLDGSLSNPQELSALHFQITAAAADPLSCMHMLDLARTSLKTTPLSIANQRVMSLRLDLASSGATLDDTESDPAYMAIDRWILRTSPN